MLCCYGSTAQSREKNCIAERQVKEIFFLLERNIAALGMSGVGRLGSVARLLRGLHGTAGLSIPLGGHSMPFGSNSLADDRADTQCRVPACCQDTGVGAAVLPAQGPGPLESNKQCRRRGVV